MYRPLPFLLCVLFLHGCASNGSDPVSDPAPAPESPESYEQERADLFGQPYIDPLTDYLIEHSGDADKRDLLVQVRQERDRRCEDVASEYAEEPANSAVLARFNTGYAYSCPEQVAAFEERVQKQQATTESVPPPAEPEPAKGNSRSPATTEPETTGPAKISDQALSDCYLLTTIRNFSAAREACQAPAEAGDIRAQTNMAVVAHAFEDYDIARQWGLKAAADSGQAAFLLGQMYAKGQGVAPNRDQAVHWYTEAVRLGHKPAETVLDQYRDTVANEGS